MDTAARPQRTRGSGHLSARFLDGRTRLSRFFQEGAAKIRIPESFDGRMEAVLINTSGGMTGGDHVDWAIDAASGTDITVTTQACERIYRSSGGVGRVDVTLKAASGARLAWLPQETILFSGGALSRRLDADLSGDAELVAVESVVLGRKAMGETVTTGSIIDRWRIRRDGRLVHAEALRLDGDVAGSSGRPAVLNGGGAFATLVYCGPRAELLARLARETLGADPCFGLSVFADKLVVRVVAGEAYDLRRRLIPAISVLKGGDPLPKVWSL